MLEEITKSSTALTQEEKDASIEIQDLTCYWDKVRNFILTAVQYLLFILSWEIWKSNSRMLSLIH